MLAWLQAVLPECKVNNLTTDWNSGVLLSALVDYCKPGLFPHWRKLGKPKINLNLGFTRVTNNSLNIVINMKYTFNMFIHIEIYIQYALYIEIFIQYVERYIQYVYKY